MRHHHPANIARHEQADVGGRMADRVCCYMGSWKFIGWQSVIIVAWVAANITGLIFHWDPYPFILLNLVFSTQAAYASPLILLAGNRAAEHDRARAEHAYETAQQTHDLLATVISLLQPEGGR